MTGLKTPSGIGREQLAIVARYFRNVFKGVASVGDHLAMLKQSLRERHEAEEEFNDALLALIMMAESRLHGEASNLMSEWTAIEKSNKPPDAKIKALRLLFSNLANQFSKIVERSGTPSPPVNRANLQLPFRSTISVEIAPGELIDRLTILEIKLERIADAAKLENVRHEYELLSAALVDTVPPSDQLNTLRGDLKAVNEALWKIEDDIRDHERTHNFGESFTALARSVYRNNDQRAAIKRQINDHLGSAIVEEKSYAPY